MFSSPFFLFIALAESSGLQPQFPLWGCFVPITGEQCTLIFTEGLKVEIKALLLSSAGNTGFGERLRFLQYDIAYVQSGGDVSNSKEVKHTSPNMESRDRNDEGG